VEIPAVRCTHVLINDSDVWQAYPSHLQTGLRGREDRDDCAYLNATIATLTYAMRTSFVQFTRLVCLCSRG